MKLRFLTTALLAFAGALLTQSAQAAFTPGGQATAGDLILAFEATSGTGSTLNYEVDLGSFTQFTAATPTFSSININADLTSIYGAGWFNDTALSWSVSGTQNSGATSGGVRNKTVFVTDPNAPTVWAAENASQLGTPVGKIAAVYNPSSSATAGTQANSLSILTTDPSSYTQASVNGTYGAFNTPNIEATFAASGTSPVTLALDQLQPGATTFAAGTSVLVNTPDVFSISSNGTFAFGAQAVPEPSTYAMLLGGFLILWQLNRRKSASNI